MDLTISIVNWNVRDYLRRCLDSIQRHGAGIEHEVIVVDNGSTDGSLEMLRAGYPWVVLIEGRENVGYGCGHNKAIALAKGRLVLFLNPDAELLPDTLSRAFRFMEGRPEVGACCCREVKTPDAPPLMAIGLTRVEECLWRLCAAAQKACPNRFTEGFMLRRITGMRERLLRSRGSGPGRAGEEVFLLCPQERRDYPEGAFLLARKEALVQAGGFDRRIFLGGEGWDLSKRMRGLGWQAAYLPDVRVLHHAARSTCQLSDERVLELEAEWRGKADAAPPGG